MHLLYFILAQLFLVGYAYSDSRLKICWLMTACAFLLFSGIELIAGHLRAIFRK